MAGGGTVGGETIFALQVLRPAISFRVEATISAVLIVDSHEILYFAPFASTLVFMVAWAITLAKASKNKAQMLLVEAELLSTNKKYSSIVSVEAEVKRLKAEIFKLEWDISLVRSTYAEKRLRLDELERQVALYDDRLAFAELGVYEPHFDFSDSEQFKDQIVATRERQKGMISAGKAATCPTNWTVDGSKSKGQVMINRQTRLTMRAFNNECEAAIANARWNNVVAMEKRILSSASAINKENTSMSLGVTSRKVIGLFPEQFWLEFVPVLHRLQGGLAAQG